MLSWTHQCRLLSCWSSRNILQLTGTPPFHWINKPGHLMFEQKSQTYSMDSNNSNATKPGLFQSHCITDLCHPGQTDSHSKSTILVQIHQILRRSVFLKENGTFNLSPTAAALSPISFARQCCRLRPTESTAPAWSLSTSGGIKRLRPNLPACPNSSPAWNSYFF